MDKKAIVAMAVAAVAEELHTEVRRIRVVTFKEVEKSSLEKYIEENGIRFQKFQLEDKA